MDTKQLDLFFSQVLKPHSDVTYSEWSRIGHDNGWLGTRNTDPATSRQAATNLSVRAGSQRHKLLAVYAQHSAGLTDEQAGQLSGLTELPRCCYWKRCSELRQAGYIVATWETRLSTAGEMQQVCAITEAGQDALDSIA